MGLFKSTNSLFYKKNYSFDFFCSTTIKDGRECPKVVEHLGLVIHREYEVLWKKPTLDMKLLARLRHQGLGSRQICKMMAAPRTTVITAIHRLEKRSGKSNQ